MASSTSDRIPCPSCGKTYRFKPELAGRKVKCQACGTAFSFPDQAHSAPTEPEPSAYDLATPADDDSMYELASDPDEERELPPAYGVPKDVPEPARPTPDAAPIESPIPGNAPSQSSEQPDDSEPVVHVSEAAKAARREELRIARAEEDSVKTWRDYKLVYIAIGALVFLAVLLWAMNRFGDFMKDGVHEATWHNHGQGVALSEDIERGKPS